MIVAELKLIYYKKEMYLSFASSVLFMNAAWLLCEPPVPWTDYEGKLGQMLEGERYQLWQQGETLQLLPRRITEEILRVQSEWWNWVNPWFEDIEVINRSLN